MMKCWNMVPEKRPTAKELCDIFTEWQNSENIFLELSESDKKLKNLNSDDMQVYMDSLYKSSFISFNYQDSKLCEWEMPDMIDE
ncbi:hypothetical protein C2G38_2063548 [Gigaspora rosea]|uniref:Serine-threonine/tyrosine-protein kinase catalytic domain-containing protein n=1 Tax=Gigaspora rosea TaxID=44941 RepID=A0A397VYL9_9GLOM|nr:hypothetical protein C2G38_2063548 [Gigaspora rosea]